MGIKVSEHVTKKFNATSNHLFRPLSGNEVSEPKRFSHAAQKYEGFRPLSGSKVSEPKLRPPYVLGREVSVPSRGVRYLNSISCVTLEATYYI